MPDDRLERTRRAYDTAPAWRRPSENAADQLEQHAAPCDHARMRHDIATDAWRCPCGLTLTSIERHNIR